MPLLRDALLEPLDFFFAPADLELEVFLAIGAFFALAELVLRLPAFLLLLLLPLVLAERDEVFVPPDFFAPDFFEAALLLLPADFMLGDFFAPDGFWAAFDLLPPLDFEPEVALPDRDFDDELPPARPAAFPAIAPIRPPTTAPTGPATAPTTAPAAAPAACLEMVGMEMFSDDEEAPPADEDEGEDWVLSWSAIVVFEGWLLLLFQIYRKSCRLLGVGRLKKVSPQTDRFAGNKKAPDFRQTLFVKI